MLKFSNSVRWKPKNYKIHYGLPSRKKNHLDTTTMRSQIEIRFEIFIIKSLKRVHYELRKKTR